MENETKTILLVGGAAIGGLTIGYFATKYYQMKNTPESVLLKLQTAKDAAEEAEQKAQEAIKRSEEKAVESKRILDAIKSTKKQYQDEIRPELESKIREELKEYIEKADETYEKAKLISEQAKKDNELADLKLKFAKDMASPFH